jgi:hypothetical protein
MPSFADGPYFGGRGWKDGISKGGFSEGAVWKGEVRKEGCDLEGEVWKVGFGRAGFQPRRPVIGLKGASAPEANS